MAGHFQISRHGYLTNLRKCHLKSKWSELNKTITVKSIENMKNRITSIWKDWKTPMLLLRIRTRMVDLKANFKNKPAFRVPQGNINQWTCHVLWGIQSDQRTYFFFKFDIVSPMMQKFTEEMFDATAGF